MANREKVTTFLDTNVISDLVFLKTNKQAYIEKRGANPKRCAAIMVLKDIIEESLYSIGQPETIQLKIAKTATGELLRGVKKSKLIDDKEEKEALEKLAMLITRYRIESEIVPDTILDVKNFKAKNRNDEIRKAFTYIYMCLGGVSTFADGQHGRDHRILAMAGLHNLPLITEDNHFIGENGKIQAEIENCFKYYETKANNVKQSRKISVDKAKVYSTYEFIEEFFPERIEDVKKEMRNLPGRPGDGGISD